MIISQITSPSIQTGVSMDIRRNSFTWEIIGLNIICLLPPARRKKHVGIYMAAFAAAEIIITLPVEGVYCKLRKPYSSAFTRTVFTLQPELQPRLYSNTKLSLYDIKKSPLLSMAWPTSHEQRSRTNSAAVCCKQLRCTMSGGNPSRKTVLQAADQYVRIITLSDHAGVRNLVTIHALSRA